MRIFEITNRTSGHVFGRYFGRDEVAALDSLARDAGYRDHAHACEVAGGAGELVVREVTQ